MALNFVFPQPFVRKIHFRYKTCIWDIHLSKKTWLALKKITNLKNIRDLWKVSCIGCYFSQQYRHRVLCMLFSRLDLSVKWCLNCITVVLSISINKSWPSWENFWPITSQQGSSTRKDFLVGMRWKLLINVPGSIAKMWRNKFCFTLRDSIDCRGSRRVHSL